MKICEDLGYSIFLQLMRYYVSDLINVKVPIFCTYGFIDRINVTTRTCPEWTINP